MTVSQQTDLQRDALTAVYKTEDLWGLGNVAFTVGSFFDPQFTDVPTSTWDREDLGTFLKTSFEINFDPCPSRFSRGMECCKFFRLCLLHSGW